AASVDSCVGEAVKRHGAWLNLITLRAPLLCDRFGKSTRWRRQCFPPRRFDRLAVEQDFEYAIVLRDADVLVEALQNRTRPVRAGECMSMATPRAITSSST